MDLVNIYPAPAGSPHRGITIDGPGAARIKCRKCGHVEVIQGTDIVIDELHCPHCDCTDDVSLTIAANASESEIAEFIKET